MAKNGLSDQIRAPAEIHAASALPCARVIHAGPAATTTARTRLIEHVTQRNVLLRALPKAPDVAEPRRIGFRVAADLERTSRERGAHIRTAAAPDRFRGRDRAA